MMKVMNKDNTMILLSEYAEKHPLVVEIGGEYIMQDDKAQEEC